MLAFSGGQDICDSTSACAPNKESWWSKGTEASDAGTPRTSGPDFSGAVFVNNIRSHQPDQPMTDTLFRQIFPGTGPCQNRFQDQLSAIRLEGPHNDHQQLWMGPPTK
jgi:hypothetical protein